MPYLLIVSLCSITLLISEDKIKNKYKIAIINLLYFVILFILVLIGGFRYDVGFDFESYKDIFDAMPNFLSSNYLNEVNKIHGEIGFKILISILKSLGLNVYVFLFVSVIIICLVLNKNSIEKYTDHFFIAFYLYICLYFFGREMGQIRQAIATAISFYSIRFIRDRKFIKFVITVTIASLFHVSSIIILPFYFISYKKYNKSFYIIILLLSILFAFIDWIYIIIPVLADLSPRAFAYISSVYAYKASLFSFQSLRRILPSILAIWGLNELNKDNEYYIISLNLSIFGTFLCLSFHEVGIFVERLFVSLTFVEILIYSYFVDFFKRKIHRFLYIILIIMFGFVYVVNLLKNNIDVFFPYKNYLFYYLQ